MKRRGRFVIVGLGLFTVLWPCATLCQNRPVEGTSATAASLLEKGRYAEALKIVEEGIKSAPSDSTLRMCQVNALLGFHRNADAQQTALSQAGLGPWFQFKAGVAAAKAGRAMDSVELWKPLYADKEWAGPSYEESVRALLALGKEPEARALLMEALQRMPEPTAGLLRLSLVLNNGQANAMAVLKKLAATDPAKAPQYGALAKVYGAADGDVFQEALEGKLPATIAVKERGERQDTPALRWGNARIIGGFDSHWDLSANEGNKTGTESTPSRVVVKGAINGEKAELLVLDSTCEVMLIASKAAKRLNLQPLAPGEYGGVGIRGTIKSQWVLIKQLQVGPLRFKNIPAVIMDEKTVYWNETGGVIPLWMFRHYGLHYDRRHGKLTLFPTGTGPDRTLGAGNFQVRSLWYGNVPYLETRIQDTPDCFLKMATVNVGTYVEERRVRDLGITLRTSQYGTQRERGLFGLILSGVADNVKLDLGPTRINLPTVLVADFCPDGDLDCTGLLGRNILDLFDLYIDYPANVLALKGYEKGK